MIDSRSQQGVRGMCILLGWQAERRPHKQQSRAGPDCNFGRLRLERRQNASTPNRVNTMSDGEDTMMIDGDEDIVITSKNKGKGKATDEIQSDDNLPW
jgi:hypothetical protein